MRRSACSFCFVCLVVVCADSARAQISGNNSLHAAGAVFVDGGSERIAGAMVRLCDGGGKTLLQAATSSSGQFNFGGLPTGNYLLDVEAAGFQSTETRLDLSFSSQSGLIIYLKPTTQTAPNEAGATGASISAHELSIAEGARNLYRDGKKKLYNENKAQESLWYFEKALAQAPDFYEARYQLGMADVGLGKTDEAEKNFRKCVSESRDKYGSANIALGTLQLDRGETEAGEKQIRHGLELSPSAWMGYYQLGRVEALEGHLDEAETLAEQARQFAPATATVYQLLATIHMRQKNYPAALEDIDAYLLLDAQSPAGIRAKQIREGLQRQIREEEAASR
ncbi:MAG: carboxypeptidase regulatory-like domain-containing protein [Candidatus Acidiferrum sp.]